ncbi:SDR family NAD(P)-dependent oxidoreductase [Mycobacterium sp.]|uniref:SDR family NAD(P)-dependent oxidoreductase n=1 Tax=Mycobacterium sp. TaxID=1785 RepID=UPI003BAEE5A1
MTIHEGQVVVMTGGASGIRRAIAERFAAAGASVVVADLDEIGAKTVAADIGPSARPIGCDVADEAQVDAAADRMPQSAARTSGGDALFVSEDSAAAAEGRLLGWGEFHKGPVAGLDQPAGGPLPAGRRGCV